jgi:hypothetical protein
VLEKKGSVARRREWGRGNKGREPLSHVKLASRNKLSGTRRRYSVRTYPMNETPSPPVIFWPKTTETRNEWVLKKSGHEQGQSAESGHYLEPNSTEHPTIWLYWRESIIIIMWKMKHKYQVWMLVVVEARTWLRCHLESKTQKQIISHQKGDRTRSRRSQGDAQIDSATDIHPFSWYISSTHQKLRQVPTPPKIALKIPCLVEAHACGALSLSLSPFWTLA